MLTAQKDSECNAMIIRTIGLDTMNAIEGEKIDMKTTKQGYYPRLKMKYCKIWNILNTLQYNSEHCMSLWSKFRDIVRLLR
jgi:hypothetical protein